MANTSFKATIGINSTPEIFNSLCSCLDCDTWSCFTHRREQKECACSHCRASQACVFYTKAFEPNDSQHDINTENIPEKQVTDDGLNESLTEETNSEDGKITNEEESLRKNVSQYLKKAEKDLNNLEKNMDSKKNTHMRSMSLTYSRPDINPGAAKLSAQVMNVPYKDFKESISYNQVEPYQSSLTKYDIFRRIKEAYDACSCKVCECIGTKSLHVKNELCKCKPCDCQDCSSYLPKMEIPERLKLSHKCAKSECKGLPMLPVEPDVCDCKPCNCIQCTDGFSKPCACEPCQCIECKHLSLHQPRTLVVAPVGEEHSQNTCLCSPCDCVQCGNFGVPSHLMHEMATGINRHPQCHCEACVENTCEPDGTDICKCERQRKVMRKPVEKDPHDYDIRRVMISDCSDQPDVNNKTKHNTIAMFAAMASTFPRLQESYKQMSMSKQNVKHECKCEECECIVCVCKEKFSKLTAHTLKQSLNTQSKAASCNCEPCECLVCSNYKENRREENLSSLKHSIDCRCDVCCCLNCKSAQLSKTKDYYFKTPNTLTSKACSCKQCDCPACRNMSNKWSGSICDCAVKECKHCSGKYVASNESLYPIKKGERFTPSIYNTKVNNSLATISKGSTYNSSTQKSTSRILRERLRGDISIYHTYSECDYIDRYLNGQPIKLKGGPLSEEQTQNTHPLYNQSSNHNYYRIPKKLDILKCEAYTQFDDPCKPISKVDYALSGSYYSEYVSYDSTPKTSDTKENSITPISGTRNKSWASSCNSSGHDNPGYLASFPKSAEVGVRVAMQLNMDKDLNLERLNNALKRINTNYGKKFASDIKETDGTSNTKDTIIESVIKNHNITRSKNCAMATLNNLNTGLVKELKLGKAPMRNNFQNITNHNRYPVSNVPNEPVEVLKIIKDNISCSENTSFEKKLIKSKYGTVNKNQEAEKNNIKAAIGVPCIDNDYKRVQNTLKEAKAFSFKLLQILEKYEKANREFVSISQSLKKSHESIINKSNTKYVDLLKMDKGDGQIGSQTPDPHDESEHETLLDEDPDQPVLEDNSTKNEHYYDAKAHVHYNDKDLLAFAMKLQNNPIEVDVNRQIKFEHIFKSNDKEISQTRDFNYSKCDSKIAESPNNKFKTDLQNNYSITTDNGSSAFLTRTRCSQHNSISKVDERTIKKRYKKYSRLLRRTIIVSRKVNLKCVVEPNLVTKACVSTEISKTFISQADKEVTSEIGNLFQLEDKELEEINSIAKRLNVVFGSTEEISASTSADDKEISCKINDVTVGTYTDFPEIDIETKPGGQGIEGIINLKNKSMLVICFQSTKDTIKVDENSMTVLKKNLHLNTDPCTRSKGVCIFPSLDVEIKEAVHSISLQTSAIRGTRPNLNNENRALVEVQVDVNKLLNMPLLSLDTDMDLPPFLSAKSSPESPFQAKVNQYEEEPMNMKSSQTDHHRKQLVDANISCNRQPRSHVHGGFIKASGESNESDIKCSCEALKVGALGVRKVSDHTVLVKWNAPRSTHDVHGYELLVDGRPVQKILSPTRCMAVVTCLPHSDKVLITIRTITMPPAHDTGHIPSTTVVYRRRAKC